VGVAVGVAVAVAVAVAVEYSTVRLGRAAAVVYSDVRRDAKMFPVTACTRNSVSPFSSWLRGTGMQARTPATIVASDVPTSWVSTAGCVFHVVDSVHDDADAYAAIRVAAVVEGVRHNLAAAAVAPVGTIGDGKESKAKLSCDVIEKVWD
jgi:hypothetical protein